MVGKCSKTESLSKLTLILWPSQLPKPIWLVLTGSAIVRCSRGMLSPQGRSLSLAMARAKEGE